MCSRVVENGNRGELCPGCQIWIQNNIELGYQGINEYKVLILWYWIAYVFADTNYLPWILDKVYINGYKVLKLDIK